jgi:hypothetical protein
MKAVFKLAVAVLVANVAWHAWLVSSSFYKFRDAVQSASQSAYGRSDDEVRGRVMELASAYSVPIREEDFTLRRDAKQLFIDGSYVQRIEVVPGYSFPWTFDLHIDSSYGDPLTIKDVLPRRSGPSSSP